MVAPMAPTQPRPADALASSWTNALPPGARALAELSRLDRPIGWQLLALPCLIGFMPFGHILGFGWQDPWWREALLALSFVVGAIVMRGAGCTYNDLLDRKIDAQVARTAGRPLPSGRVSVRGAIVWLLVQLGLGALVLLALPTWQSQVVALLAVPLVGLYPLMKRITWWPQVWLGLTFSWGVLVADAALTKGPDMPFGLSPLVLGLTPAGLALYLGCVAFTVAYDTLYALQDRDEDALIGVRSTALRFGTRWRQGTLAFYTLALFAFGAGARLAGAGWSTVIALGLIGALLIWPLVQRVREDDAGSALAAFKANFGIGLWLLAALLITPLWWTLGGLSLGFGPPP